MGRGRKCSPQMWIGFSSCLSAQPVQTGYHQPAGDISDCHGVQVSQAYLEPWQWGGEGVAASPVAPPQICHSRGFPWPSSASVWLPLWISSLAGVPDRPVALQFCPSRDIIRKLWMDPGEADGHRCSLHLATLPCISRNTLAYTLANSARVSACFFMCS